jgi:GTP-binding protein EngB required for normal cell division
LRQRVVVVATKADKLSNKQRTERERELAAALRHLPVLKLIVYSSVTGMGKKELWLHLNKFLTQ